MRADKILHNNKGCYVKKLNGIYVVFVPSVIYAVSLAGFERLDYAIIYCDFLAREFAEELDKRGYVMLPYEPS